ncbi:hypothetical protein DK880_00887 [Candidatus Cardinium hertigii]|uniref:Transposase n=1 Tax=Candidatus Cardinium hertigii TaxID=247481 RepID=A0A2Z3LES0_9BACT|nr:hypothetical protein DK880_00887 [Candidatus Cardinium hertigii]
MIRESIVAKKYNKVGKERCFQLIKDYRERFNSATYFTVKMRNFSKLLTQ